VSVRIVLAEDHHLVRKGLCALINEKDGLQVVGEADTGKAAVRLALELTPDLVIMDVTMPELNGVEATRQIRRDAPRTRVLALSMHRDPLFITEMLRAGASGYLLKTCIVSEFTRAIEVVMAGQTYLSPDIAGVVAEVLAHPEAGSSLLSGLTPVQRQVLQLLAEGLTTKQAALRLGRSVKTVEMHRRHVMEKLGVSGIANLTKLALRAGLITSDS